MTWMEENTDVPNLIPVFKNTSDGERINMRIRYCIATILFQKYALYDALIPSQTSP